MNLNADQKECVKEFLASIDVKSLLECDPDKFEDCDWDEALEAIDNYIQEIVYG